MSGGGLLSSQSTTERIREEGLGDLYSQALGLSEDRPSSLREISWAAMKLGLYLSDVVEDTKYDPVPDEVEEGKSAILADYAFIGVLVEQNVMGKYVVAETPSTPAWGWSVAEHKYITIKKGINPTEVDAVAINSDGIYIITPGQPYVNRQALHTPVNAQNYYFSSPAKYGRSIPSRIPDRKISSELDINGQKQWEMLDKYIANNGDLAHVHIQSIDELKTDKEMDQTRTVKAESYELTAETIKNGMFELMYKYKDILDFESLQHQVVESRHGIKKDTPYYGPTA